MQKGLKREGGKEEGEREGGREEGKEGPATKSTPPVRPLHDDGLSRDKRVGAGHRPVRDVPPVLWDLLPLKPHRLR